MALPVLATRDGSERRIPLLAPPTVSHVSRHRIFFLHPDPEYAPPLNELFSLPRFDRALDTDIYGVHHRTALTACQIVANNAFNGYLALDTEGNKRVDETVGTDDVLTGSKYYFICTCNAQYPIVPSFRDWQFPHENIPDFWPDLPPGTPQDVCLITRFPWALENAHIVPSAQADWFDTNAMSKYVDALVPNIDMDANLLSLKSDMHKCFDRFMFTLVPKPQVSAEATEATGTHTVHVLDGSQAVFASYYHDVQLPHLRGVAREYLFARFALAIFMALKPFINMKCVRRIVRYMVPNPGKARRLVFEEMDGLELQRQYGGGKSRSASPSKRKRPGATDVEAGYEEADTPDLWSDVDSMDESVSERETSTERCHRSMEEEERGRSRKKE